MIEIKPIWILWLVLSCLLLWWAFQWVSFYQYIQIGKRIAEQATAYSRVLPTATKQILVIGDSTAVGTGATDNSYSVPALLASVFPEASVTNLGVNGALISDLNSQLELVKDKSFDLVLIQAGANDVVYFSDLQLVDKTLATVLQKVRIKSDRVIMMSSGDIGAAPIWPFGVGYIFTHRTKVMRENILKETTRFGVKFVDLYANGVNEAFGVNPTLFHAADSFHPSNEGYGLWFEALHAELRRLSWVD